MNKMPTAPVRVMIVEDSGVVRLLLERIVEADPRLVLIASVDSGEKALEIIGRVRPDVVSLDIQLPGIDGFETTRRIMAERPTPIVVVSAHVDSRELNLSMNALKAGALSIVEKPVGSASADFERIADRICRQLVLMSDVKVIQRRGARRFAANEDDRPQRVSRLRRNGPHAGSHGPNRSFQALGIVASTGGPNAVVQILRGIGDGFPLPIFLVQHITDAFHDGFVRWLAGCAPMPVFDAENGAVPKPGCVYVAPAGGHLVIETRGVRIRETPPVNGQRPSGTELFNSMARVYGKYALAALLTGMGSDGAVGLRSVFDAGGYTIAEDETTAVVYGMPKAAVGLGAVTEQLPLSGIAPRLRELAGLMQEVT